MARVIGVALVGLKRLGRVCCGVRRDCGRIYILLTKTIELKTYFSDGFHKTSPLSHRVMNETKKNSRWRLVANAKIQGGLLLRVFLYWCAFQFVQSATILLFHFISNGEVTLVRTLVTSTIASFVVLPILMLDLVEFSNRFVGPIHNLGNRIKELSDGMSICEFKLRRRDFYQELIQPFNQIRATLLDELDSDSKVQELPPEIANSPAAEIDLDVECAPPFPAVSIENPISSGEQHA